MTEPRRLQDLIDLAREPSSEKRRELLREVTELFFGADPANTVQHDLYGVILEQLTREMEEAVRAEMALRFAVVHNAPRNFVRSLARDDANPVAAPMLAASPVLEESDLLEIVRAKGQGHLRAVSVRGDVPEAVSDVIVQRGDDETLNVLVANEGAQLSRTASEAVIDRAQANPALHEAVVNRAALPADLLNEMYFVVEARLRDQILERNSLMDPAKLDAALNAGRDRVAQADGALPDDYDKALALINELNATRGLTPEVLVRFLRSDNRTEYVLALAQLAEIDFHTARRIVDSGQFDALAVVCKAADLDRAVFLTYAMTLVNKDGDAMAKAQEYGRLYADLTRDTALRTIRFWRMRRTTGQHMAVAAA